MTRALRVLADENINPAVVAGLRKRGWDIRSVVDEQLVGAVDADVLARAVATGSSRGHARLRLGRRPFLPTTAAGVS